MVWAWVIAGILLAGMLLFAFSDIILRIRFARAEGDDELSVDVKGLYGLLCFRYAVPVLYWSEDGLRVKTERIDRNRGKLVNDETTDITRDKVERYFRTAKETVAHTLRLVDWGKRVMAHIVCTEMRWSTKIGLGDAANTAITTGVLWGIKTSLLALVFRSIRLETKPALEIEPQFNRMHFSTKAHCLLKLKAGYALYAGVLLLFRILRVKGGLRFWRKLLYK